MTTDTKTVTEEEERKLFTKASLLLRMYRLLGDLDPEGPALKNSGLEWSTRTPAIVDRIRRFLIEEGVLVWNEEKKEHEFIQDEPGDWGQMVTEELQGAAHDLDVVTALVVFDMVQQKTYLSAHTCNSSDVLTAEGNPTEKKEDREALLYEEAGHIMLDRAVEIRKKRLLQ